MQTLEYFGWKWWWPTLDADEAPDPPQPYNRYDNLAGMDLVLKLGFVDQGMLEAAEAPDWEALTQAIPESVPWREQDHMVGRASIVEDRAAPSDMLSVPGRAKRRQQAKARALVREAAAGRTPQAAAAAAEAEMGVVGGEGEGEGGVKRGRGRKPGGGRKKAVVDVGRGGEGGEGPPAAAAPKKRGRKPKSEAAS